MYDNKARGDILKINIVKYIFILFVIGIIGFVVFKLNEEKNNEPVEIVQNEPEEEIIKEINLGVSQYDSINPLLSNNKQVQELAKIIFEPMLQINSEYKIEKCLAKDWAKTSETQYIIKLDNEIKWSDGNKLTADDVIFTIQTIKNLNSIYSDNVKNIVGVNKIDENTIRINLDQQIPFFEYNLIFPILSAKYFEGQDFVNTEKNNMIVGTGKYKIIENSAEKIVLEKNENYKREELTTEKITINKYANLGELYNAFKLGKVDLITTNNIGIENYIGTIGYNKTEINGREYDFLAINTQSDILSNKEVRQAIARAINRDNIISQVYNNKYKVQDYFLDYGSWLQGEKADFSYSPDTAISILQNNGWEYKYNIWQKKINYRTKRIKINLVVQASNQTRIAIAEMIKTNLEEVGIDINIIKANDRQYESYLTRKNYDMLLTGVTLSLSPNLQTFFGPGNLANYNNEEINSILNEVQNITKEDLLKEKYNRIRQIYNDELPYIGLYSNYYEVASNWTLKGSIPVNWYNIYDTIGSWYKN